MGAASARRSLPYRRSIQESRASRPIRGAPSSPEPRPPRRRRPSPSMSPSEMRPRPETPGSRPLASERSLSITEVDHAAACTLIARRSRWRPPSKSAARTSRYASRRLNPWSTCSQRRSRSHSTRTPDRVVVFRLVARIGIRQVTAAVRRQELPTATEEMELPIFGAGSPADEFSHEIRPVLERVSRRVNKTLRPRFNVAAMSSTPSESKSRAPRRDRSSLSHDGLGFRQAAESARAVTEVHADPSLEVADTDDVHVSVAIDVSTATSSNR